jgi:hypothetical protein
MTRRTKIFVFGDSFGDVTTCGDDRGRAWPAQLAKRLAEQFKRPIEVINWSMVGASQDHTWSCIMRCVEKGEITPDDYMVVLMTSPERYWFFEHVPYITNTAIIDFDDELAPEQTAAAAQYLQYIQRPQLTQLHLDLRLGWLSNIVHSLKLRKPLMIPCFEQQFNAASYPALNFSRGCLYNVQLDEWQESTGNNWQGVDLRFMHLCLRNHTVLSELMAQSLWRTTILDLGSEQFHRAFLTHDSANDPEFFAQELSSGQGEKLREIQAKIGSVRVNPWAKRMGIST